MNILDQIKSLDKEKIVDDKIKKNIETALKFYDQREELTEEEVSVYKKLFANAETHIKNEEARIERLRIEKEKAEKEAEERRIIAEKEKAEKEAEERRIEKEKQEQQTRINNATKQLREMKFDYIKALEQFGGDIPTDVKKKITGIKLLQGKATKNPTNEKIMEDLKKADTNLVSYINSKIQEKESLEKQKQKEDSDKSAKAQEEAKKAEEAKVAKQAEIDSIVAKIKENSVAFDKYLDSAFKSGKSAFSKEEMADVKLLKMVLDISVEGEENGVATDNYILKEDADGTYKLTKKTTK